MKYLSLHKGFKKTIIVLSLMVCVIASLYFSSWAAVYSCEKDAYIDALYPDDNFGGSDRLLIANTQQPTRALLKFTIPLWVTSSNISKAHIVIYSAPWTGGGGTETDFEIYTLTQTWVEGSCVRHNDPTSDNGATWNQFDYDIDSSKNRWNSPGGDYDDSISVMGTFPLGTEWGPFPIDVTDIVKSKLDNGRDYGFLIKHPLEDKSRSWQNFSSRNASGYEPFRHPYLEITFLEPPPNDPPYAPSDPSPAHGDEGVSLDTILSWSGGDPDSSDAVTYDVYFGNDEEPELVSANQTATTYQPSTLSLATSYNWKIIARDNYGEETQGDLWKFTTVATAIPSIYPNSGSPFYFMDVLFIPLPMLVTIKGEKTHFRFPDSQVSFNDDNIKVLFSFPISDTELWALVVITEAAEAGLHNITVTTSDESAIGTELFEVVRFWRDDETVTVEHKDESIPVQLKGLPVRTFKEKDAVRLSDIVEKSTLVTQPEKYFYNLIASDDYSLERGIIVGGWGTGLPPWSDMQKGYLYQSSNYELLTGWENDTIGGRIGQCYNVKWMNGGTIELRENDILE